MRADKRAVASVADYGYIEVMESAALAGVIATFVVTVLEHGPRWARNWRDLFRGDDATPN